MFRTGWFIFRETVVRIGML